MKFEVKPPPTGRARTLALRYRAKLLEASLRATEKAGVGAKDELRQAMRGQRLGNLANTIGSTSDRKKRRVRQNGTNGFDVAGFVFARIRSERTAGALQAYLENDNTTIKPVRGRWLWIATQEIPRRAGRRRMTPALYNSTGLDRSIGPLQFIPGRRPGIAFLVVQQTTIQVARSGKARAVPKSGRVGKGRREAGIIAFIGIRRTRRSRRIDPRSIARNWQNRLPALLRDELGRR